MKQKPGGSMDRCDAIFCAGTLGILNRQAPAELMMEAWARTPTTIVKNLEAGLLPRRRAGFRR